MASFNNKLINGQIKAPGASSLTSGQKAILNMTRNRDTLNQTQVHSPTGDLILNGMVQHNRSVGAASQLNPKRSNSVDKGN
jgi:hypothetical protein